MCFREAQTVRGGEKGAKQATSCLELHLFLAGTVVGLYGMEIPRDLEGMMKNKEKSRKSWYNWKISSRK